MWVTLKVGWYSQVAKGDYLKLAKYYLSSNWMFKPQGRVFTFVYSGNSLPNHPGHFTTPSKFNLLWDFVRYTKVIEKYQISEPGIIGNPIFQSSQKLTSGPKNDQCGVS